jgi:hypothetical protein
VVHSQFHAEKSSDLPPLLAPGVHPLTAQDLYLLCVKPFSLSQTRNPIFAGLSRILSDIDRLRICCSLVVDGSFLTEEIDPADIDFAVCVSFEVFEACTDEQAAFLNWIGEDKNIKISHLCDCYLCVEYPEDHPSYFDGIQNRVYWVNLFAKSKVHKRERGVALIEIAGTS